MMTSLSPQVICSVMRVKAQRATRIMMFFIEILRLLVFVRVARFTGPVLGGMRQTMPITNARQKPSENAKFFFAPHQSAVTTWRWGSSSRCARPVHTGFSAWPGQIYGGRNCALAAKGALIIFSKASSYGQGHLVAGGMVCSEGAYSVGIRRSCYHSQERQY